jgi:hypothetical protein
LRKTLFPAALKATQLDDHSLGLGSSALGDPSDQDFGRTGKTRYRVEIAGIEKQDCGNKLV